MKEILSIHVRYIIRVRRASYRRQIELLPVGMPISLRPNAPIVPFHLDLSRYLLQASAASLKTARDAADAATVCRFCRA